MLVVQKCEAGQVFLDGLNKKTASGYMPETVIFTNIYN